MSLFGEKQRVLLRRKDSGKGPESPTQQAIGSEEDLFSVWAKGPCKETLPHRKRERVQKRERDQGKREMKSQEPVRSP